MAQIAARGFLRVAVDQSLYLFGYRNPQTLQLEGFDIDIARAVAEAIFEDSDKIFFRTITSAERIPALRNGDVDIVADVMTITCDRKTAVNFSTEYLATGQRILVRRDSTITGVDDLGNKKVCALKGSPTLMTVGNAAAGSIPVGVEDWTDCLVLLQQNQVDAISSQDIILAALAAQDPNTQVVGDQFTDDPVGLGIPLQNVDMVRFVNGVLEKMRTDGTWAAIHERWLGGLLGSASPPRPVYAN